MRVSVKICLALILLLLYAADASPSKPKPKAKSAPTTGLAQTIGDFQQFIRSILDYFLSSPIRDDTFLLLRKTVGKLTKSLELFGGRMLNATEVVAQDMLHSLKNKLNSLEAEYQDLSRLTDEKFERIIIYVNNTIMEQSIHMNAWASNLKEHLRSMNDTSLYAQLCPAIDALIQETTDELASCCNIVIKPVRSICRSVKVILRETFHVVADVVETVDNCIFSEKEIDSMVMSCLEDIYDDVCSLMDRAAALQHTLMTKLPTTILLSNFCVSMVSVTMATRKTNVEQQIEYLNN